MALSAQNQSTSYVNLYYSIVQRAATRYFKEYYNSGEYQQPAIHYTGIYYNRFFVEIIDVPQTRERERERARELESARARAIARASERESESESESEKERE